MNKDLWNDFYSKNEEPNWATENSFNEAKKYINGFIAKSSGCKGKLLDFGCGISPHYVKYFKENGYEVICTDISDVAIEKIKLHNLSSLAFDFDTIEDLKEKLKEHKFDVIFCWGVMHHIPFDERKPIIDMFSDFLKPEGILIISGWDKMSDRFQKGEEAGYSEIVGSKTYYINKIEPLINGYCFKINSCETYSHYIEKNRENLIMKFYVLKLDVELRNLVKELSRNNDILYFHDVLFNFKSISEVSLKQESTIWFKDRTIVKSIYDNGRKNISGKGSLTKLLYEKQGSKKNIHIHFEYINDNNKDFPVIWENEVDEEGFLSVKVRYNIAHTIAEVKNKNESFDFTDIRDFLKDEIKSEELPDFYFTKQSFLEEEVRQILLKFFSGGNEKIQTNSFHFYYLMEKIYEIEKNDICATCFLIVSKEKIDKECLHKIEKKYIHWTAKKTTSELINLQRNESIKSAIAAIMSRNLSHNLGSHVVSNTRYQIENLSKDLSLCVQRKLNGIAALLGYLQERQDFIAVIANDDQHPRGPLNFKVAVFDMLAVDGPTKRHGSDSDRQVHNYVLDNIVRSEEIFREGIIHENETSIEIQMVKVDERGVLKDDKGNDLIFKSNPQKGTNYPDSSKFTDIELSVPYGLSGRQAFLVILENLIRNAAKHSKKDLRQLIFSIIIKDIGKSYEITIADNKQNCDRVIKAFIAQNVIDNNYKLKKLNILSKDRIDYNIDRKNKGIKEILIALSWLKNEKEKVEYHRIEDDDNHNKEMLKIVGVDEKYKIYYSKEDIAKVADLSLGYAFTIDKYLKFHKVSEVEIENLKKQHQKGDSTFSEELAKLPSAFIYVFPDTKDNNSLMDLIDDVKKHLTRVVTVDSEYINNDTVASLYENLIKTELCKSKELPILIAEWDETGDPETRVVRKKTSESVKKPDKGKDYILYLNHYDNRLLKENFIQPDEEIVCKSAEFVEGISGGNSTHNLIRTKIDKLGYLKIVEAALTKIAIIDERMFRKFNGVTVNEDVIEKVKTFKLLGAKKNEPFEFIHILKKIAEKDSRFSIENYKDTRKQKNRDASKQECIKKEIIDSFDDDSKLIDIFATNFMNNYNENIYCNYLKKKKIFIFNHKEGSYLDFIDLNGNILPRENSDNFDFISIHLGLIDKIKEENYKNTRDIITDLKKQFSKSKLVIHSGRGGLADIENIGFIPFSGIDWAVDNCKYVLAELFYGQFYK